MAIFLDSHISGSSTSTGSFGAVSIGKGTADNQRALTVVGNVQLDNNNAIYFKRSTGTADPHIIYNSNNDFNIFNPLAGEIKFAVGSAEVVVVDSGGLTFNGSKTIGSSAGSGVITILGNSGLKLKSGGGGGSGPIELIQGSTTYWSVGASGALTGSADLVMNAGKNISGSATSTGSFGKLIVDDARFKDDIFIGSSGTSGFRDGSDTNISVYIANTARFKWYNNGGNIYFGSNNASGPNIYSAASSTTNATYRISGTHNTGWGGSHLRISGIISGTEVLQIAANTISGSSTSTGSFGRVEATSISASLYQGQIGSRYVHSQTSDSATWTINHNIGHKYPVVTVYDTSDQMILPETGTATDSDTFTLTFNEAIQGKAVVSVGGIGENAGGNYIFTQDSSTTNWRVTHSLSQQYPNVTVYDGSNQVIIPESITAASSNEMDITFSDAQSGYANFSIGSGIPNISSENAGKVLKVRYGGQGVEWSPTSNDVSGSMSVSGSIIPNAHNSHDLGSDVKRWRNIYSADLQLSNENTEGNEVDGTTGNWTIQEGASAFDMEYTGSRCPLGRRARREQDRPCLHQGAHAPGRRHLWR